MTALAAAAAAVTAAARAASASASASASALAFAFAFATAAACSSASLAAAASAAAASAAAAVVAAADAEAALDKAEFFDPSMLNEGAALGGVGDQSVPLELSRAESRRCGKGKNRMGHGRKKGRKARRFAVENPYGGGAKMDDMLYTEAERKALLGEAGRVGSDRLTRGGKKSTKKQERRKRKEGRRKQGGVGMTMKTPF